jgi:predicted nucleic acid binding AN1-type Zn finger protein
MVAAGGPNREPATVLDIAQKFSYQLGATCFTKKECNSIPAKYMPTVLSKMGINRSTPTEVRSRPALYAGMSVSKLWPLQGSTKNKLLIGHL